MGRAVKCNIGVLRSRRLVDTILVLLLSWITAELIGYSLNTMQWRSDWTLGKSLLHNNMMGAREAKNTRNLFATNRLNLSVWHGYQEVLHTRPIAFGEIKARVRVASEGYLDVLLSKNPATSAWLRVSVSSDYPSAYFETDITGRQVYEKPLSIAVPEEQWFWLGILHQQGRNTLRIEGSEVAQFDRQIEAGLLGFRGAWAPSKVDEVYVSARDGTTVIADGFRQSQLVRFFFSVVLALLIALYIFVHAVRFIVQGRVKFFVRGGKESYSAYSTATKADTVCTLVSLHLVFVLLALLLFDYFSFSRKYPDGLKSWIATDSLVLSKVEKVRLKVVAPFASLHHWYFPELRDQQKQAIAKVHKYLELPSNDARFSNNAFQIVRNDSARETHQIDNRPERIESYFTKYPLPESAQVIVLVGTSQTFGTGALRLEDRLSFQVFDEITRDSSESRPTVVLNIARVGSRAEVLRKVYQSVLPYLGAHTVVINLGNNDSDLSKLSQGVRKMLELHRMHGGKAIVVQEPVRVQYMSYEKKYQVLAEVAKEFGAALLPMVRYFSTEEVVQSGHLWWDRVHLTSYGQQLLGKQIAEEILRPGVTSAHK